MRYCIVAFTVLLAATPLFAQRHALGEINTEKPDGQLLAEIGQQTDTTKKLTLLEQFAGKYPDNKALGWVYEQMQALYLKTKQPDKALATGEKLVAMDPGDLDAAQQNLKAAEMKKDPDLITKWAVQTAQIAQKVVASPQPTKPDDVNDWKQRVEYAKEVKNYTEYSLYASSLQTTDPQKRIELLEALQNENPQSQYTIKSAPVLLLAYQQTGANDKAAALAEKVVQTDQSDENMLLVAADNYLRTKGDPGKAHAYCEKIFELLASKPKPQGMSDADWNKRKNTVLGVAHYINGKLYFNHNQLSHADKELKEALPLVGENREMKAEVLFLLGLANYKLKKIQEAANYNRECAAIPSPFQKQAAKNLAAIKSQYMGVK